MFTIVKNAEAKLLEVALGLKEDPYGYYAIQFHLSQLQEHNRSQYQIKIAVNILQDIFKSEEAGAFILKDHDVFFLYKGMERHIIEKAIFQLRYLFSDDPLAYQARDVENHHFASVFDLEFHINEFIDICKHKLPAELNQNPSKDPSKVILRDTHPSIFQPKVLAKIESDLQGIDIRHMLRTQPICAINPSQQIQTVLSEMYVHIAHLKQLLLLNVDLHAHTGLFQYLTEILDRLVLYHIKQQPKHYFRNPLSLNFNISTLLSKSFAELDALLDPKVKSSIVIEIAVGDVFNNYSAYTATKEFLKNKGYRLCLDGLTSQSFVQVNRKRLGVDLMKLCWNADIESRLALEENKLLVDAIEDAGANRVILCRCDSPFAIEYGHALGISLFQGRHIDKLVNPKTLVQN